MLHSDIYTTSNPDAGVIRRNSALQLAIPAGDAGLDVPGDIYAHIAGIDIVRDDAGEFKVLEDNLRVPSACPYMLENRKMLMRLFPELFPRIASPSRSLPRRAASKPAQPSRNRRRRSHRGAVDRGCAQQRLLQHAFLAQQMGIELVEGQDLFVRDEAVFNAHHPRPAAR